MIKQELKDRVIAWAEARNFFGEGGATVEGQLAKLLEEASELVTDIVRGRDATDSVGDCIVVLTILERMGRPVVWVEPVNSMLPAAAAFTFARQVCEYVMGDSGVLYAYNAFAIAQRLSINPNTALEHALREIEPRRGSWSGGVFVKEAK